MTRDAPPDARPSIPMANWEANHWWNGPPYVTDRGLATSLLPHDTRGFEVAFDFIDDRLRITTTHGAERTMALEPRSVANFYADFMTQLDELGLHTAIWTMPVEIPDATPFDTDERHASYDAPKVRNFRLALVQMNRVLTTFRGVD